MDDDFQRAVLELLHRLDDRSSTQLAVLRGLEDRVVGGSHALVRGGSTLSVSDQGGGGSHLASLGLIPELASTLPPDAVAPSNADSPVAPSQTEASGNRGSTTLGNADDDTADAAMLASANERELEDIAAQVKAKWEERVRGLETDLAAATADKEALWDQLEAVEERKETLIAECTLLQQQIAELKVALDAQRDESEPSMSASMLSRSPSMSVGDSYTSPLGGAAAAGGDARPRGASPVPRVPSAQGTQGEQTLFGFRLRFPHVEPTRRGRGRASVGAGAGRPKASSAQRVPPPALQRSSAPRTISLSSPVNDFSNTSFTGVPRRSPTPPLQSQAESPGYLLPSTSEVFPAA